MPLNFAGIRISYLDPCQSVPVQTWKLTALPPDEGVNTSFVQVVSACAADGVTTARVVTSAVTSRAEKPLVIFIFFMSLLVSHS